MDTTWQAAENGEVVFENRVPLVARAFTGAVLTFVGSFFLYTLLHGLYEYRKATLHEWLTALPGILVVFALVLLFGLPAFAVWAFRRRVVLDVAGGRIMQVYDFRVYCRVMSYPVAQVRDVRVAEKRRRWRRDVERYYEIRLVLGNDQEVDVAFEDDLEDARKVASAVADHLGMRGARA